MIYLSYLVFHPKGIENKWDIAYNMTLDYITENKPHGISERIYKEHIKEVIEKGKTIDRSNDSMYNIYMSMIKTILKGE